MTFISSNRFRPEKFGTLYGLGIFSAGLFGLLEYPCYTAVNVLFDRDPFWVRNSLIYKLVIVLMLISTLVHSLQLETLRNRLLKYFYSRGTSRVWYPLFRIPPLSIYWRNMEGI